MFKKSHEKIAEFTIIVAHSLIIFFKKVLCTKFYLSVRNYFFLIPVYCPIGMVFSIHQGSKENLD